MTIEGSIDGLLAELKEQEARVLAARDAAVTELAAFAVAALKEELSGSSSTPGGPPAERTGTLAGSVTAVPLPSPTGLRVWVGTQAYYGRFLNDGWHPGTGTRHRRSTRERKALQRSSGGAGKAKFPYLDNVVAATAAKAATVADDIRLI